jgi:4-amino-4-deoxy-L-arabinose transferase-like glycosyltransferase
MPLDLSTDRFRAVLYTLILTAAASWVMFTNLGGPRLEGDEAWYAMATDHVRESGEWLTLRVHPPEPYFGKPPLYMWLSVATYDLAPDLETKYRLWSALFGVGCVAATCVLGAMLLSPEIGAIGGGLLLTNRQFLFEHGARDGAMDTGLTFLLLVTLILYWRTRDARVGWGLWIGIGITTGIAWLLKPFFGLPLLLVIAVHRAHYRHDLPGRRWIAGLILAFVVMLAVGLPWYLVQWARFGRQFFDMIVGVQIVDRFATALHGGESRGHWFYVQEIMRSSYAFYVFVPAAVWAMVAAVRGTARAQFGLLALIVVAWVAVPSLSTTKFLHYAYLAFPAIGLLIAAGGAALCRLIQPRTSAPADTATPRPVSRIAFIVAAIALTLLICQEAMNEMPRDQKKHLAWEVYRTFQPAIERGEARLIIAGLTSPPGGSAGEPELLPADLFYLRHMNAPTRVSTQAELESAMAIPKPTVALLARTLDWRPVWDRLSLDSRTDERFHFEHRFFTVAAVDVQRLLEPRLASGVTSPHLEIAGAPAAMPFTFERAITVRVRPPLPQQDARLVLTFRRVTPTQSQRVRCRINGVDNLTFNQTPIAFAESMSLSLDLEHDRRGSTAPRDVTIVLTSADDRTPHETIRAEVTEVRLWIQPEVARERAQQQ